MSDPVMKFRRVHFEETDSGDKKRAYVTSTAPTDDSTDDGHSSDTEDLYIGGGGGGGAQRCRVKYVYGDYVTACTWDGTTEGAEVLQVAKPPHLRHIASESTDGNAITYTYGSRTSNNDGQRTAHCTGKPDQDEIVVPTYKVAAIGAGFALGLDEIWVDTPKGGTGVTVSGVALTLMDTNRDARAWCQI